MALWEIARVAFGASIALFGVYGKLYGSVGIGVALLVWLYYSATLFVVGAELAARPPKRRQEAIRRSAARRTRRRHCVGADIVSRPLALRSTTRRAACAPM
jgi:membrane protein